MHLDVQDLRDFYYRSALGRAAQKVIRDQLVALWPDMTGLSVAGFGFAVPLMRPWLTVAERVIALMPGPQGVMPWPGAQAASQGNVSVLVEETLWPLPTGRLDRLVLLHGLETSDNPAGLLDECWRVLGPGGRAVFIVPNRAGLWSRVDRTPFGFGRPYSPGQLSTQLRRHGFAVERSLSTLYQPPSAARAWRKSADLLETLGRHLPVFKAGGVLFVEATKQVMAPTRPGLPAAVRRRLPVLHPVPQPALRGGDG